MHEKNAGHECVSRLYNLDFNLSLRQAGIFGKAKRRADTSDTVTKPSLKIYRKRDRDVLLLWKPWSGAQSHAR